ncbi:uncharacterized protein LACBIDRAFT_305634 [Laccaria bicolor S238N-H82]|uniref:Predicted protein n=1 Tax=Laccaria bicolor (strain S238N-H82 / ATCC MYA-4686) TaxID=486041 RepID=B0CUP5_LACBS|nr:uncharacterized protein LACBIDRAFT_305634 [Laccaria bicolor S238N-H82]EDR14128.1 predicted protein [Laccaria bicolor S238N-H82]|eukprot:XP_001874687.1 predicted protein [Laccaria bicolor S238N-H82]
MAHKFQKKYVYLGEHTPSLDVQHLQRALRSFVLAVVTNKMWTMYVVAVMRQNDAGGGFRSPATRPSLCKVSLAHENRPNPHHEESHIDLESMWLL